MIETSNHLLFDLGGIGHVGDHQPFGWWIVQSREYIARDVFLQVILKEGKIIIKSARDVDRRHWNEGL